MILRKHDNHKSRKKRHDYLLRNILWIQVGEKQYKMFGSRPSGRNESYSYYITHAKLGGRKFRLHTRPIDRQIPDWLQGITVKPDDLPKIQEIYQTQFDSVTKKDKEKEIRLLR